MKYPFTKIKSAVLPILLCVALVSCSNGLKNKETKIEKENIHEQEQPNIIFILADDMGYNVPGSYGGKVIQTPNIDKLAKEGMLFTNSYAGNSVCAPSRASLMTGLHTGHTSVRGNTGGISIKSDDITIGEVLRQSGYTTGVFGKWGLGDFETEGVAEKQGFDEFFGYYHQIHAHFYYTDYLWRNSEKIKTLNKPGDSASFSHYRIMKEMKSFITKNKDKPFFCYSSWTLPHTDDLGDPQIPETDPAYLIYKDKPWSDAEKKYAAMNTLVDYSVGEVKELVEQLGIEKNTIIIFASDNGGGYDFDELFDVSGKFKGFKHQFYEGGIKAVSIFYWDGKIQAGSVSDYPNYFADIMPTFAELAGANKHLPKELDGISLVPTLLNKGEQKQHQYMYWELPAFDWDNNVYNPEELQQAIRVGDWKLLRHHTEKLWELYNIKNDPEEKNNMADKKPEMVKKLIEKIKENRTEMPKQIEPEMPEAKWYR